jgi:hypothetical protein
MAASKLWRDMLLTYQVDYHMHEATSATYKDLTQAFQT